MNTRGFTLIELLIVVAIIAILAAIAVPNFLEAQTRAKISRNQADMRTAHTALETYRVDYNKYPYDGYNFPDAGRVTPPAEYNYWFLPKTLSTPVQYLNSANMIDPFRPQSANGHWQFADVRYKSVGSTWGEDFDGQFGGQPPAGTSSYYDDMMQESGGFILNAAGPDRDYGPPTGTKYPQVWKGISTYPALQIPYDSTNGTVSLGDILRTPANPSKGWPNAGG